MIIGILIFIDDGFPIFFKQRRIGLNNSQFLIYKFRTMKKNTPDIPTHLIENNKSLYTLFGPMLRRYSLDEIPQLINIIKGEMSFIGPRPALHNQKDLIDLRTKCGAHKLFPGVTGWAQVNGRDELSIEKKVELDSFYAKNESLLLDLKIIILTLNKVFKAEGVKV